MPKIRVLVVDDAVVMRKLISEALSRDAELEVVGVAANGRIALQKVPQLNPDLITLDIEMPEMDGLETLRELRKAHPKLPVIMFSTLTTRAAAATLDALSLGAADYVTKPANVGSVTECIDRLQSDLVAKIKVHCRHLLRQAPPASAIVPQVSLAAPGRIASRVPGGFPGLPEVVCIATSTGGPNALAELFRGFPGGFHLPLLIVQHMPPLFTAMLAERLNKLGSVKFYEGAEGQTVQPGHAYLAPGGKHMEVRRTAARVVLHLQEEAPENSCRPAADVLFRSAVSAYGGKILGVVMTGMGQDGLRGCELIREQGGHVVVQDELSSVVWGMPGSVAQAGCADKIVPLDQIAGEITRRTRFLQPLATHT
jgi:two-component system chemotaxis response regulator CheB